MREIKFRARKKTVYNYGTTYESKTFSWVEYFPSEGLPDINEIKENNRIHEQWVHGQVEVQFTGLKILNDEIHEGDLLSNNYKTEKEVIRQVVWVDDCYKLERIKGKSRFPKSVGLFDFYQLNYKIIGNIHENPELTS